jgi:protein-S-isoprenylcysteine O-methyltransferase Ste14
MIFYLLGVPLLLDSFWGLLWGLGLFALFAIRILVEERTLKTELQGYREYTARVRYRLIPLAW